MHRNPVWIGFLTIIAIITAWFITQAVDDLIDYQALSKQTPVDQVAWEVKKLSESHYVPRATYNFYVEGDSFNSSTTLDLRSFRNEYGVREDIKKLREREWNVWYDPDNPSHSALDKWFPLSSALSGGFMLAIFLYFIWLGRYVTRRAGE